MKIKILFVMYKLSLGGAEKSLVNLLSALDYNQFDVDLLVFEKGGELEKYVPSDVNFLDTPKELIACSTSNLFTFVSTFNLSIIWSRLSFKNDNTLSSYRNKQVKWEKVYKNNIGVLEKKYDIAVGFLHSLVSYFVIDKVDADKKHLWVHNDYDRLIDGKDFDYNYFSKADKIITISKLCEDKLISAFPEFKNKIMWLNNLNLPSTIEKWSNEFYPKEYLKNIPNIVSIGRLSSQKRFDLAVKAASLLKQKGYAFNWCIIGDGELKKELTNLINELDVNDCVKLIGKRVNPYPYVKEATLVLQTSDFEGKSIVIDEAKILHKAIITTNYDTAKDQITSGITGLIVDKNEVAISDGIINLLTNVTLRNEIENNLVSLCFNYEKELINYFNLFKGVL